MAFCENCGTQISDAAKFCGSCGKAVGAGAALRLSTPSKRSNAILKLIVGGVAFCVLLVAGAVFYYSHRAAKNARDITQAIPDISPILKALDSPAPHPPAAPPAAPKRTASAEGDPDVSSIVNTVQSLVSQTAQPSPGSPASPKAPVVLDKSKIVTPEQGQCAIFTKEELTKVLGDPFTHADADATGCVYKGDGRGQYLRTEVVWTGGHKLLQDKAESLAFQRQSMVNLHYSKAEIDAHEFPAGKPYSGVADEGWITMWPVVTGRKGDVGFSIDLRAYPPSDNINRMLVNTALARLTNKKSDSAAIPATQ